MGVKRTFVGGKKEELGMVEEMVERMDGIRGKEVKERTETLERMQFYGKVYECFWSDRLCFQGHLRIFSTDFKCNSIIVEFVENTEGCEYDTFEFEKMKGRDCHGVFRDCCIRDLEVNEVFDEEKIKCIVEGGSIQVSINGRLDMIILQMNKCEDSEESILEKFDKI